MERICQGEKFKPEKDLCKKTYQAVKFRRDQMPVMDYDNEVIIFNDKGSHQHTSYSK